MLVFRICCLTVFIANYILVFSQWTSLPIRSQAEFNNGSVGGEGEQYFHGFSRCLTNPDYIYAAQDVSGAWRSVDGGTSWKKCLDKGLYLQYSQSIEVDPINPNKVFIVVDQSSIWPGKVRNFQGVYSSENGGESWMQVLSSPQRTIRKMRHLISYSLASMPNKDTSPTRWYVADSTSLWRSDLSGNNGTWIKVATNPAFAGVTAVVTHPTSIDTIYVCTETGLYRSTNGGENLAEIIQFSTKRVTSVLMNADLPNTVFVTIANEGMYLSVDNGHTFEKQSLLCSLKDISSNVYCAVMNPGFPEQIYLIGVDASKSSWVSNDGGETYNQLPNATTFTGLGRETGWRRWLDGIFCGICPNSLDKSTAIGTSRSTIHKISNFGATVTESATGFTGNAAMQTDRSIAFHSYDTDVFGIFCFDVGPRITSTNGKWFHESDPILSSWRAKGAIQWGGSYSAAFQPIVGSETVIASIGMYISNNQLMRSTDNGRTWGIAPVTPNVSGKLQAFHFIAFDPEIPTIVYAGDQISKDSGLSFNGITFPLIYSAPTICGVSKDLATGKSYVFAIDSNRKIILRSDDHGLTWLKFFDLNSVFSSARFLDSTPTFAAHPTNPNVIYTLDKNRDLIRVAYDPITAFTSVASLNVFDNLPIWIPEDVKSFNQIRRIGIDPVDPNVIYVAMLVSGIPSVYRSLDNGQTWTSISDDLPHQSGCIVVNPHTREVYRGSMSGTYIHPAPSFTDLETVNSDVKIDLQIDNSTALMHIVGAVEGDCYTIFDMFGRKFRSFSCSTVSILNLSSGVYILKSDKYPPRKFLKRDV